MHIKNHKIFGSGIAVVILLGSLQAQQPTELPRHPGEVIKFEVKFDGHDASKVKTVSISLRCVGPCPKGNQPGFSAQMNTRGFESAAPSTFYPEVMVQDNIATGEYLLSVHANADPGSADYEEDNQFKLPPIRIENPKTFEPPHVTVKERP